MSSHGKVFYINHNDKTTHWTRPPALSPGAASSSAQTALSTGGGSPSSPDYTTPVATMDVSRLVSVPSDPYLDDHDANHDQEPHVGALASSAAEGGAYYNNDDVADAAAVLRRDHAISDDVDSPERAPAATVDVETTSTPWAATPAVEVDITDRFVAPSEAVAVAVATAWEMPPDKRTNGGEDVKTGATSSVLKTAGLFGATIHGAGGGGGSSHGTPRSEIPEYLSGTAEFTKSEVANAVAKGGSDDEAAEEPEESPLPEGGFA